MESPSLSCEQQAERKGPLPLLMASGQWGHPCGLRHWGSLNDWCPPGLSTCEPHWCPSARLRLRGRSGAGSGGRD
ncbi:hypothetical protein NDU88_000947 [Pleurodeles waltl]|uniref:Uncharacterized protein n=1 Tax=Pleurodeles waltl TaxID=8319 RepID=A0AAV7SY46_PLEWA|nr:hypothetical protein NDU88_000947 [Pleurodeles waltl]